MSKFTGDIEANNLLNDSSIDYTASPYRLKSTFDMHCAVFENHETGEIIAFHDGPKYIFDGRRYEEKDENYSYILEEYTPQDYTHFPLEELKNFVNGEGQFRNNPKYCITEIVGHNIINYDLLAIKLFFHLPYSVKYNTWGSSNVQITDTMILSKVLNPDRFGGHSLEDLSKKAGGDIKINFRKEIPVDSRFKTFAADMLYYCIYDNKSNTSVYNMLMEEWGDYGKWKGPFELEQRIADIITRQEHRGFAFNMKQAEFNIKDLDQKMEDRCQRAEPILPAKPATKGYLKDFIPPKLQFKKNGEPTSNIVKFAAKHNGELYEDGNGGYTLKVLGKEFTLPLEAEIPICDPTVPATLNDTTHIKNWLVGLGWSPSEYKDKDLTLKSGTKLKKDEVALEKGIKDYVTQTLESNFCADRCEHLGCIPETLEITIRNRIAKGKGRGLKVLTNPSFTKGQDKEICPNLAALGERFPFATDIVEYLTFKHRRNSILGGGVDWDDPEEDIDKGYMAAVRADGRIPTPAATCDCSTSRMKHRLVANIPRVSSLYGEQMRSLFGVESPAYFQIGYDFASLEARIEAHYTWKYDIEGKPYCNSLLLDKPHDVHCYDQETEIFTLEGWKFFGDLKPREKVAQWQDGRIEFVVPSDIVWQDYKGEMVSIETQQVNQLITPNHRMLRHYRKSGRNVVITAREMMATLGSAQFDMPVVGVYSDGNSTHSKEYFELLVAVRSEGHFTRDSSAIAFSFTKERKIARLETLLSILNMDYSKSYCERKGRTETIIRIQACDYCKEIREILTEVKALPISLLNQSLEVRKHIVKSMSVWDGTVNKDEGFTLDTTCRQTRDVISALATSCGYRVYDNSYMKVTTYSPDGVMMHRNITSDKPTKGLASFKAKSVKMVDYEGKIGCVVVPSGLVLVRRDHKVFVSGNTKTAEKISEIIDKKFDRGSAKAVKYGCTYGAQAPKVAKTIGSDIYTGELVYNAFWEAAAPLAELKEKLNDFWVKTGKTYILGIDGRKVPTRSAHAILNSLFQSAGVICAKRAMVIYDDYLEAEGFLCDFFVEDWKNKAYAQQMISYHDEAQLEVSRNLVQFKWFSFEELGRVEVENKEEQKKIDKACLAKVEAWKKEEEERTGKIWANIHTSPRGGWYTAYSRPGELASISSLEAGRYYNLNIDLAAEYDVGRSWSECH